MINLNSELNTLNIINLYFSFTIVKHIEFNIEIF